MTWEDRLQEAAYTAPGGRRVVFAYEDVSKTFEKKTTAFEFPDGDGTYVQDLGPTGRRFPLRVFFTGSDHDLQADEFEDMLREVGIGRLEHPRYGVFDAMPFGTVSQIDQLKTAANQTAFEVAFWETTRLAYLEGSEDLAAGVLSALSGYNDAAAGSLAAGVDLRSAIQRVTFKNTITRLLDNVSAFLAPVAAAEATVRQQFGNLVDGVANSVTVLLGDPLTLAFQITQTITAPARAAGDVSDRLSAYADLFSSIIGGDGARTAQTSTRGTERNTFYVRDTYAATAVSGSVLAVVNGTFTTRPEALAAAEEILDQFEAFTEWRDDRAAALSLVDTGAAYQQLQEAVSLAASFLVSVSFSLKQERRTVLTRARTIVDLAAELYGEVDGALDYLISTNRLTGSEILELPRGREIVYYV